MNISVTRNIELIDGKVVNEQILDVKRVTQGLNRAGHRHCNQCRFTSEKETTGISVVRQFSCLKSQFCVDYKLWFRPNFRCFTGHISLKR